MNILITGGAGFIGQYLIKRLLSDSHSITTIDNNSRNSSAINLLDTKKVNYLSLDLRDNDSLSTLNFDYEVIIHLAAIVGVHNVSSRPYSVLEDNVIMLSNLLQFAKRNDNLKKFMFFSTSEVYAGTLKYHDLVIPTPETSPITLSDLAVPRTSYMLSKLYGEAMVIQSGLPYLILRPHNIYGPNMGMSHVIPQLVEKSITNERSDRIKVDSVNHTRAFCYIDDAIEQITRLIYMKISNDTFNIGNMNEEVSIGDLANKIFNLTSKNQDIETTMTDNHSPVRRCPDMSKLENFIGELNYTPLKIGLKEYIDWYVSK